MNNKKGQVSFEDLLDHQLSLWPAEIDVTERIQSGEDGVRYPELVRVHDRIEPQLVSLGDPLREVMCWTIYKAVHRLAAYQTVVRPAELLRDDLRKTFEHDLSITPELRESMSRYRRSGARGPAGERRP